MTCSALRVRWHHSASKRAARQGFHHLTRLPPLPLEAAQTRHPGLKIPRTLLPDQGRCHQNGPNVRVARHRASAPGDSTSDKLRHPAHRILSCIPGDIPRSGAANPEPRPSRLHIEAELDHVPSPIHMYWAAGSDVPQSSSTEATPPSRHAASNRLSRVHSRAPPTSMTEPSRCTSTALSPRPQS
jgi:hypothetical protein